MAGLNETSIEGHWTELQNTWKTTCVEVLGKKGQEHKVWMTPETWAKIEKRREPKQKINQCQDLQEKEDLSVQHGEANRQVKKSTSDKRRFIHGMTEDAERQDNMKGLYEITQTLSGKNANPCKPIKDKMARPSPVMHSRELSG